MSIDDLIGRKQYPSNFYIYVLKMEELKVKQIKTMATSYSVRTHLFALAILFATSSPYLRASPKDFDGSWRALISCSEHKSLPRPAFQYEENWNIRNGVIKEKSLRDAKYGDFETNWNGTIENSQIRLTGDSVRIMNISDKWSTQVSGAITNNTLMKLDGGMFVGTNKIRSCTVTLSLVTPYDGSLAYSEKINSTKIADLKAKQDAETKAKEEAEIKARAKAKEEAVTKAKAKEEAETKAKQEALAQTKAKEEAEIKARAKAKDEAEAKAKQELEAKLKQSGSQTMNPVPVKPVPNTARSILDL